MPGSNSNTTITINSPQQEQHEAINLTTPDGNQIIWGFMFENTLFTPFERRNHPIIEAAYRQRKKKHCSHHINIVDSNLPKPGKAKVYFGVAQNHLRMPGTRYYVTRQIVKATPSPTPQSSSSLKTPMLMPSPTSTFSSSSFSSLDAAALNQQQQQLSTPVHQQQKQKQYKRTTQRSSKNKSTASTRNNTTLQQRAVFTNDLPLLVDVNYSNYSPITPVSSQFSPITPMTPINDSLPLSSPSLFQNKYSNNGHNNISYNHSRYNSHSSNMSTSTEASFVASDISVAYLSTKIYNYDDTINTSNKTDSISSHSANTYNSNNNGPAGLPGTVINSTASTFIPDFNQQVAYFEDPAWLDILYLDQTTTTSSHRTPTQQHSLLQTQQQQQKQQPLTFQEDQMISWTSFLPSTAPTSSTSTFCMTSSTTNNISSSFDHLANSLCNSDPYFSYYYNNM